MQSVKGLEKSAQHTKLQELGKLLQAFGEKNPNSVLHVEKDADNRLQRLFIRPGAHANVTQAMLINIFWDCLVQMLYERGRGATTER